jgi:hypothetical protein
MHTCQHTYGCNATTVAVYRGREYCRIHYMLAVTRHEQVMRVA